METNSELEQQINARLQAILADYAQTPELAELAAEVESNLMAAVIDKVAQGEDEADAIDQAFAEFGDIKGLADELAAAQPQSAAGADQADAADADVHDIARRARNIAAAAVSSAERATKQAARMQAQAKERAEIAAQRAEEAKQRASEQQARAEERAADASKRAEEAKQRAAKMQAQAEERAAAAKARAEAAKARAEAARKRAASGDHDGIQIYGDAQSISVNGQVVGVDITADEAENKINKSDDHRVDERVAQNVMHAAIDDINTIVTDHKRDDVEIVATDDDQITVSEYFHRYRPDYNGRITRAGDTLTIASGVRPLGGISLTLGTIHLGFWSHIVIAIPRTFAGKLTLKNDDGNLSVRDFEQPTVLSATNSDGNIELVGLGIKAVAAATADGYLDLRESKVETATLTSQDGNIEVTNVHAEQLSAHTADGAVTVTNVRTTGAFKATSGDGNVTLHNVNGEQVTASTADGDLSFNDVTGSELAVATGDGDADLQALSGAGSFTTGDGDLDIQFTAVTGDITVKSGDGDVDLVLPRQSSYTFDLHAGDGHVDQAEDDVQFTKHGKHRRRGQKGATPTFALTAETGDGDLRLH